MTRDVPMTSYFRDPTLAELLSDPMTRAVMRADGVNPQELEASFRDLAARHTESSAGAAQGWWPRLQLCGAP
jgi:hypothetical protein